MWVLGLDVRGPNLAVFKCLLIENCFGDRLIEFLIRAQWVVLHVVLYIARIHHGRREARHDHILISRKMISKFEICKIILRNKTSIHDDTRACIQPFNPKGRHPRFACVKMHVMNFTALTAMTERLGFSGSLSNFTMQSKFPP